MQLLWHEDAWDDYCYLQSVDKNAVCASNVSVEQTIDAAYKSLQ